MFIENLTCSSHNGKEALLIKKRVIKILADGRFKLYKCHPNYWNLEKSDKRRTVDSMGTFAEEHIETNCNDTKSLKITKLV